MEKARDNTTAPVVSGRGSAIAAHARTFRDSLTDLQGLDEGNTRSSSSGGEKSETKVKVETRSRTHRYWIRRPHALQYFKDGNLVQALRPTESGEAESASQRIWSENSQNGVPTQLIPPPDEPQDIPVPVVRRRQLDIFIDLLWVGIVGNVSDKFSESAFNVDRNYGRPFFEFIVLFMLSWQIWNYLRRFLNEYYMDDMVQRAFVMWIMLLALAYGNNANLFLEGNSHLVLIIFLTAKGSFVLLEVLYCNIFIPELRRLYYVSMLLVAPAVGLYIGSIFVSWPTNAAFLVPALLWEEVASIIIASPLVDRLLAKHMKKVSDLNLYVERLENFFIIILGNGVFNLITKSPLGVGIDNQIGIGVQVLLIYYLLFIFYSTGDSSKFFIPAVRRNWWGAECWLNIHLLIYAAVLILEVALTSLIAKDGYATPPSTSDSVSASKTGLSPEDAYAIKSAKWTAAGSFAITVICMTGLTLLNRSVDPPGTLVVNNRYMRMLPRAGLVVVVTCLPIQENMSVFSFVSIIMWLMYLVGLFEWWAGLEKGWRFLEPKKVRSENVSET